MKLIKGNDLFSLLIVVSLLVSFLTNQFPYWLYLIGVIVLIFMNYIGIIKFHGEFKKHFLRYVIIIIIYFMWGIISNVSNLAEYATNKSIEIMIIYWLVLSIENVLKTTHKTS